MEGVCEDKKGKISEFIELSLSLLQHGFDEMEMQKKLEFVKLLGETADFWVEKTYGRMLTLEYRVSELEKIVKNR
jgi:hypothetical protein